MVVDNLEKALFYPIADGLVKTFRTKGEALKAGTEYGWKSALKINRRFEKVWVVAQKDFQPNYILDIRYDNYRVPLLRWDKGEDGIERCPVVQFQVKACAS